MNLSLRSSPLKERLDTVGCKYQFTIILHREIVLTLVLLLANHFNDHGLRSFAVVDLSFFSSSYRLIDARIKQERL